ncbi:substrate-binding periplasmic protein [Undibacterium terreum]|uniref:substrate-binding periplasmic protein n=1 Tax=Undibacterium terreum TaxID=1224302 RepID=UPI001667AD16|nr:transporter substrate-binding domain-containing protein [Undibacterium terreum]
MKKILPSLFKQAFCIWLISLCGLAAAEPLNFCFEDVNQVPWTTPDGAGLHIELLKQVQKRLGESFVFHSKPWKRCQEEVRNGSVDGFFGASYSNARSEFSVFPLLQDGSADVSRALCEERQFVYLRKGSKASWDGKKLTNPRGTILVQRGYNTANILRERGFRVDESVKSAEDGLLSLALNKADVAVLRGLQAEKLVASDPRFQSALTKAEIPFDEIPLYLAVGKSAYSRNAARIEKIWNEIRSSRHSEQYRKLLEAAGAR